MLTLILPRKTQNTSSSKSASKVQNIPNTLVKYKRTLSGYKLKNTTILASFVSELCCPSSFQEGTLSLDEKYSKKRGFASCLSCKCSEVDCKYEKEFYTPQPVGKFFDVHRRMIYSIYTRGLRSSRQQ